MEAMERMQSMIDAKMETLMETWHVEGLSLGIVKDGQVILEKGYGKRNKTENLDMTEKTVLPIGSATKSFTALSLAMLADEGKVDLDQTVKTYIPWLELYNHELTEHVTVRDLLCHRTGLPRYDAPAVFCTKDDRKEMVEDLRYLQPNAQMRTVLQYSNQMVMLAGYLVEVLSGKTWEQFVKERILEKLGMNQTDFFAEKLEEFQDHAKGYVFTGTENMQTEYLPLRGLGPAGSIVSTAGDMNQYLLFQLGDGTWKGERLVSQKYMEQMHEVQMLGSPYLWKLPEIEEANYGLCWFVDRYRGQRMVSHGGNTLGFSSLVTMLPRQNFGVTVLTNSNSSFLVNDLTYRILDEVLGATQTDWTMRLQTELGNLFGGMAAAQEQHEKARVVDTKVSHPLEAYAGTYTHPAFGAFCVQAGKEGLTGTLNGFQALFRHYHYDVYDVTLTLMGLTLPVRFLTGWDGVINGLQVILEGTPGINPVTFNKEQV